MILVIVLVVFGGVDFGGHGGCDGGGHGGFGDVDFGGHAMTVMVVVVVAIVMLVLVLVVETDLSEVAVKCELFKVVLNWSH